VCLPLLQPPLRAIPELMEAMPEFVEQPLYSGNHYVTVVSGTVSQFIAISGSFPPRGASSTVRACASASIYCNFITIKRLITRAISLIKDVARNEVSR